ncbi:MAG: patatin-like phospholipase family protein, partial [Nostocales cyanobacterium 94392]|nr:patatin-like phospholipase family protein [Nostocales cyanobacterium 94392]
NASIFDPEPIEYFLKQAVHPNTLRQNIELWVTVFPSLKIPGLGYDLLIDLIRAKMGATACWLCLQDCRDDETIYNLLLASAALPLAFPSREVNGINYIDGGLVENVRLKALAKRGCKNVIVIHLKNGSVWNRNDFPEQTIIEIRPEKAINKSEVPVVGVMDSWLDFSTQRITKLKQQGYEDAKRCLNPIIDSLISVREYRQSQASLVNSTQQLVNDAPL